MSNKLRIRHAGGSVTIAAKPTVGEIAKLIEQAIDIPIAEQAWKCGFPPRPSGKLNANDPLPPDMDLIHVSKGDGSVEMSTNVPVLQEEEGSALPLLLLEEPAKTDPEGFVVRRVMEADNSCLFNSLGYTLYRTRTRALELRKLVADSVLNDPQTYNEAFLGRPTDDYAKWISQLTSWGGQIELSILSQQLQTEIAAFDVIRNRYDIYGTDYSYKRRVLVIYDGIHYDALAFCFDPSMPEETDITEFSPNDDAVMARAQQLCEQQHRSKSFTDTSNFTLRCLVCQKGLNGATGATEHAESTGHANFAEFQ